MAQQAGARIEKRDGHKIERYLVTANAVLEGPTPWPGRYIPIVPAVGIEMQIGRRRLRRGVIRMAKDAQRAYNYARSTQTEVVALQPKAPFVGTEKQFKGYEEVWATANTEKPVPALQPGPPGRDCDAAAGAAARRLRRTGRADPRGGRGHEGGHGRL